MRSLNPKDDESPEVTIVVNEKIDKMMAGRCILTTEDGVWMVHPIGKKEEVVYLFDEIVGYEAYRLSLLDFTPDIIEYYREENVLQRRRDQNPEEGI